MKSIARGKALVAKLKADPEVRDAEALAAYAGRTKKYRKLGKSAAMAAKLASKGKAAVSGSSGDNGGGSGGGGEGGGSTGPVKSAEIKLSVYTRPGSPKTYVAEIVGSHSKYGLDRKFQSPAKGSRSGSGKTGTDTYQLEDGKTYEIQEAYKDRRYATVKDGKLEPVAKPAFGGQKSTPGEADKVRAVLAKGSKASPVSADRRPTAAEVALSKLKAQATQPIPTSLPRQWKEELTKAENAPGLRSVLKRRALSMSKMTGAPTDAAVGKMLLEEIRKRGW